MNKLIIIILLSIVPNLINAQVDRSKAPQPAPAPEIKIGEYTKYELANGLKVFVIENHRIPRVSFSISLIFDPILEGKNVGIGSMTSSLIGTGTKTRTKDQINEELDFISANLSARPTGIYASSLKKYTPKLLEILSDVTMNSVFKEDELEKKRTQTLSSLAANKDDPDYIGSNVSSALFYGKNHPYGEFETEASIKSITLDMCNQYYKQYFKPNIACLAIVGDITPAEAKKMAEKYFGSWQKGEVKSQSYSRPQLPLTTKVAIVDRPQAVQSIINIGFPIDLNPGNPDYIKASVTNTLLGGGEFRLFMNLREKHAYTYGAYSRLNINPLVSSFKASTSVRNAVTDSAISQILYEMKRLREEPVPASELNTVKNYLTGNFALSLEDPQTIASFAVNTERYKLPKDFYANFLKNIDAVSVSDVQQMAQKYLLPNQSIILVVGKASEVADKLKPFSVDNNIEYYDIDGNPYDPSKQIKPIPDGVTTQTVLNKYIEAAGGSENISKIKDLTLKANASIQGMKLNIDIIYKIPGKYSMEVSMNNQTFQKMKLNGETGKSSGMQGDRDLSGEELEKLKLEAALFPELNYEKMGYKAELKGIKEINGKDAYLIEITSPLNSTSSEYYSVESGLKIKTESIENTPMGKVPQTAEILEYMEVNGVKLPKITKQSAGPQTFDITVDSAEINKGVKDEDFK